MQIKTGVSKKRISFIVVSFIAFFALSSTTFYLIFGESPFSNTEVPQINLNAPMPTQQKLANDIKKQALENSGADASSNDNISVKITSITQKADILQIRSLINSITNNGNCALELSRSDMKVVRSSSIQAQPSSSTCEGFDVPVAELATGTWNITLTVSSESGSASDERTVEIK